MTVALGRGRDFADGESLPRKDMSPLTVKHGVNAAGDKVWRVAYLPK